MFFPYADDNPTGSVAYVTYLLVAINVLSLLQFSRLDPVRRQEVVLERGFIAARLTGLAEGKPVLVDVEQVRRHRHLPVMVKVRQPVQLPADGAAIALTLLTSLFMHGGWVHLIGNMWFLLIFGNNIEDRFGHVAYLIFYLMGGLLATGCHWLNDPHSAIPVIGASGAVAAVLGAYAVAYPHSRVRTVVFIIIFFTVVDLPAFVVLGVWFLGQILSATQDVGRAVGGGVAWWAHIGGFVAGAAIMFVVSVFSAPDDQAPRHAPFPEREDPW